VRCWYRWLIRQNLWVKGVDVTDIGIRHRDSKQRADVLNPYKFDCILPSASTEGTKDRVEVVDKIITRCASL